MLFKGIFDTLTQSRQGSTFEAEMQKFKAIQLLSPLKAIPTNSDISHLPGKDTRFQKALDCIRSGAVVADLGLMQDLLRYCALEGKPAQAQDLLKQMKREYGVQPTEHCKEILAYAQLKAGKQDDALTTLSGLTEISNRIISIWSFCLLLFTFSGSVCGLEDAEGLSAA